MKVAILSSFPLVDYQQYKKVVLAGVAARAGRGISDAVLVYAHTGLRDYYREARDRFGFAESVEKFRRNRAPRVNSPSAPEGAKRRLSEAAAAAGIGVMKYDRFHSAECLRFLAGYRPDVIHNLSGMYIPRAVLALAPGGVVSGHYGSLPEVRGGDTIRWSLLLDVPLAVTHMALAPEMDMGDILYREEVPVRRGDRVADLREKCQEVSGRNHLQVLDRLLDGTLTRVPQVRAEGNYFYRMGRLLREKVDLLLAEQRYSHYAGS